MGSSLGLADRRLHGCYCGSAVKPRRYFLPRCMCPGSCILRQGGHPLGNSELSSHRECPQCLGLGAGSRRSAGTAFGIVHVPRYVVISRPCPQRCELGAGSIGSAGTAHDIGGGQCWCSAGLGVIIGLRTVSCGSASTVHGYRIHHLCWIVRCVIRWDPV